MEQQEQKKEYENEHEEKEDKHSHSHSTHNESRYHRESKHAGHKKHSSKHHHKTEHKSTSHSGQATYKTATIILSILLAASIITIIFLATKQGPGGNTLAAKNAAEKSIGFINTNLLQGTKALLKNATEEHGVYKITVNIQGKDSEFYITKDAEILFPYIVPLTKKPAVQAAQETQDIEVEYPKSEKPKVLLFTMSYCPYGNIAEEGMKPALKLLETSISFEPHYVLYGNYCGWGLRCKCEEGANAQGQCNENPRMKQDPSAKSKYCLDADKEVPEYCSMHGIQELNENIRELCIWKYENAKYWDFVLTVNNDCNAQNVDSCWENVAKTKGIDTARIKKCFDEEKTTMAAAEAALNKKYQIQGSPSTIINDAEYAGGRSPEEYKIAICSAMNTPAKECSQSLPSADSAGAAGGCAPS